MGGDVLMNWVSIVFVFLVGVGIFVEDRYGSLNFCFFWIRFVDFWVWSFLFVWVYGCFIKYCCFFWKFGYIKYFL